MDAESLVAGLTAYVETQVKAVAHEAARKACADAATACGTSLSESAEFKAALAAAEPRIREQLYQALDTKCRRFIVGLVHERAKCL